MPLLAKQFEHVFPELNQQLDFVTKVIKEEEEGFLRTLEKGLKRMDDIIHTQAKNSVVEGQLVFELFDTFGFPVDLTRLIASENELLIDEAGFEQEMQQQKDSSRAATAVASFSARFLSQYTKPESTYSTAAFPVEFGRY